MAFRIVSLAELEKDLGPELPEEAYRRGYRAGWIAAYNAAPFRREQQSAYDRMFDFWMGALLDWMRGDCSKTELPPEMPRR